MIIRTLEEILKNSWGNATTAQVYPDRTPLSWYPNKDLNIDDVAEWEEILYIEGVLGVYVSWDPYEEFYILVHNLHLEKQYIEVFEGNAGVDNLIDRCRDFGIELPEIQLVKS